MRVIIVDDEQNALENLQGKMEEIPEIDEIILFSDPQEAFDYACTQHVDVAFLDIKMPGMSGLEIAYKLKSINIKTNIIFVTGYPNYALDAFKVKASDYLLKPASVESIQRSLENLRYPVAKPESRVRIQCFGGFDVFVDGEMITIQPKRAKELLAYLVDRRGTSVTPHKLAAIFWEDKPYDRSLRSQVQTIISQMMKALKENGIEDIVIKKWNSLAIDPSKIECDFYDFLNGNPNAFTAEYMSDYSWAELTNGWLPQSNME